MTLITHIIVLKWILPINNLHWKKMHGKTIDIWHEICILADKKRNAEHMREKRDVASLPVDTEDGWKSVNSVIHHTQDWGAVLHHSLGKGLWCVCVCVSMSVRGCVHAFGVFVCVFQETPTWLTCIWTDFLKSLSLSLQAPTQHTSQSSFIVPCVYKMPSLFYDLFFCSLIFI